MDLDENFMLKWYWSNFMIATSLSVIQTTFKDMKKNPQHMLEGVARVYPWLQGLLTCQN